MYYLILKEALIGDFNTKEEAEKWVKAVSKNVEYIIVDQKEMEKKDVLHS